MEAHHSSLTEGEQASEMLIACKTSKLPVINICIEIGMTKYNMAVPYCPLAVQECLLALSKGAKPTQLHFMVFTCIKQTGDMEDQPVGYLNKAK